jgi:hypothetical protein
MSSSVLLVDDNPTVLSALSQDLCWCPLTAHRHGAIFPQGAWLAQTPTLPRAYHRSADAAAGWEGVACRREGRQRTAARDHDYCQPGLDIARHVLDAGAFDFLATHLLEELAEAVKAALRWHNMTQQQAHIREALRQATARQEELETRLFSPRPLSRRRNPESQDTRTPQKLPAAD